MRPRRIPSPFWSTPLAMGGSLVILAACATKPAPAPTPAPPPPPPAQTVQPVAEAPKITATPNLSPRERLHKLLDLLDDGQRDQARAEAEELLKQQPGDALAKSLLDQIDLDPKALLGERSFAYTIRPGETLSLLAERFLGDKYLFYALARYNGIDAPRSTEVGRTIMIPGVPRDIAPPSRRKASPEAPPSRRATPAPAPAPAAPVQDAGRASALRRQALVLMNKGEINGAVGLLRQAAALNPGDSAISSDLARAVRLQAAGRR